MVQQVFVTILVVLSTANADVSHLNGQNGYRYSNLGLTSGLKLHTSEGEPAPTQYRATYGDALRSSYVPPPSGSPFNSVAPLQQANTYSPPSTRLSVPLQSPLITGQKFGQTQFQQPRAYQTSTYQKAQTYQAPKYQTPAYQSTNYQPQAYQPQAYQAQTYQPQTYQAPKLQPTFQTQGFPTNTFNNGLAQRQTAQAQTTQAQTQYQNNQEPIVTKHFYVHAAPEDPEEDAGPRLVQIGLHFFFIIIFFSTFFLLEFKIFFSKFSFFSILNRFHSDFKFQVAHAKTIK